MTTRYVEYKKRRLIKLQQRVQELEKENAELKSESVVFVTRIRELESEIYYLNMRAKR